MQAKAKAKRSKAKPKSSQSQSQAKPRAPPWRSLLYFSAGRSPNHPAGGGETFFLRPIAIQCAQEKISDLRRRSPHSVILPLCHTTRGPHTATYLIQGCRLLTPHPTMVWYHHQGRWQPIVFGAAGERFRCQLKLFGFQLKSFELKFLQFQSKLFKSQLKYV